MGPVDRGGPTCGREGRKEGRNKIRKEEKEERKDTREDKRKKGKERKDERKEERKEDRKQLINEGRRKTLEGRTGDAVTTNNVMVVFLSPSQ